MRDLHFLITTLVFETSHKNYQKLMFIRAVSLLSCCLNNFNEIIVDF